MKLDLPADVLIVGAGNAALCAALAAREQGAGVLILEWSSEDESGGNSRFSGGAMRFAYRGVDDLRAIMPDLSATEILRTDFGTYTTDQFFDDMFRVTQHRTDPDLCERLVMDSYPTMLWLASKGLRFVPMFGRQAFRTSDGFRFWGGLTVETVGGGIGLVDRLTTQAKREGVEFRYGAQAVSLIHDGRSVVGVRARQNGVVRDIAARSVVLACGGFEANAEWRSRYLGPGWELAKVRGTRFNTGDGIRMALDIGASPFGHWSGCHAVGWDFNAPEFGSIGDGFQKHSFPWSIMVNTHGRRFVDEGADFRNYTYARMGKTIMDQPGQCAWQIFDRKVLPLLRDEYRFRKVTKVSADTLEALIDKMEGVDRDGLLNEIRRFNAAVCTNIPFDPNVKDGRCTAGLPVAKSNWANAIDEPPFEAYQVSCAITYTYGGLRVTPSTAQVIDTSLTPIPGLYAAGELVGGLFYFNYPGGSGLTSGSVFGRAAGAAAARAANPSMVPS